MNRDRHRLFGTLRPPGAPPELRRRTLSAARGAAEIGRVAAPPRVPLTDRLWASRPLRVAWAASVAVLLGVNVWMGRPATGRSGGHEVSARGAAWEAWGAGDRGVAGRPRTLLASREEVLEALLGQELSAPRVGVVRRPS